MFQLYFGAFDLVLYLGGLYAAMTLAKAICDQMDEMDAAAARPVGQLAETDAVDQVPEPSSLIAPMQPIPAHLRAPVAKPEGIGVKVSVRG